MIRKMFLAPMLVIALVAATAAPALAWGSGTTTKPGTIVDVLTAKSGTGQFDNNPNDYDILLTAVKAADLVGPLSNPAASLTLFAPDDAAFIRTARSLGYTGSDEQGSWNFLVGALTKLGNGNPIPVLKTILLYHVAPERLSPIQVLFSGSINTLANTSFRVQFLQLVDNAPKLPNPYLNIFALNQQASNGVIHGITRVLIPVDIG